MTRTAAAAAVIGIALAAGYYATAIIGIALAAGYYATAEGPTYVPKGLPYVHL